MFDDNDDDNQTGGGNLARLFLWPRPKGCNDDDNDDNGKPKRRKRGKVETHKTKNMKKAISFIKIVGYVLGAIGGVGWSLYEGSYAVAAGCVILAWLAWPELKKSIDNLTE